MCSTDLLQSLAIERQLWIKSMVPGTQQDANIRICGLGVRQSWFFLLVSPLIFHMTQYKFHKPCGLSLLICKVGIEFLGRLYVVTHQMPGTEGAFSHVSSHHQETSSLLFLQDRETYQNRKRENSVLEAMNNCTKGNHFFSICISLFLGCFCRAEMAQAWKDLDKQDRRTNSRLTGESAISLRGREWAKDTTRC